MECLAPLIGYWYLFLIYVLSFDIVDISKGFRNILVQKQLTQDTTFLGSDFGQYKHWAFQQFADLLDKNGFKSAQRQYQGKYFSNNK